MPLWLVVLLFLTGLLKMGWIGHVFNQAGWPLLDAMNAAPLAAWATSSGVKAVTLLGLNGVEFAAWTIVVAIFGEELRRRGSGERG